MRKENLSRIKKWRKKNIKNKTKRGKILWEKKKKIELACIHYAFVKDAYFQCQGVPWTEKLTINIEKLKITLQMKQKHQTSVSAVCL